MKYENMTVEECIFSYKMGINSICDADSHTTINEHECFHCGKMYIAKTNGLYCPSCINKFKTMEKNNILLRKGEK